MANTGTLTVIRQNPLFRDLDAGLQQRLAELCTPRRFAAGELLCRQGEPGDALYGLISGQLRISASSFDGQELHLNVIGPGEVIGEIALLDGRERTATATALKESNVFVLPRDAFLALVRSEGQLATHLLELLCQRVRWTSDIVEDVVFRSVPMRLARRVAILGRMHGEAQPEGTLLRLSQSDLAQFLNVSRQVVNVNLQSWQRHGVVELGRGRLLIKSFEQLERLASEDHD
ncbi:MAG: Crp/Fnr family transcriptional regulator [Pseudomonadota bacterium]